MSNTVDYVVNDVLIEVEEKEPKRDLEVLKAYIEKSKTEETEEN